MPELTEIVKANDVRGLVGLQLDYRVARAFGSAFARAILLAAPDTAPDTAPNAAPDAAPDTPPDTPPGRVIIGHDMRDSSPELVEGFADGVTREGADVVLIGLCSTDGLYYASGALDAPGVMFTASHNPSSYNGMKLCRSGARPIGLDSGLAGIRDLAQALLDHPTWAAPGSPEPARRGTVTSQDTLRGYAEHLRGLAPLPTRRTIRIVVDAGNGMAGLTVPAVLEQAAGLAPLPLEVVPMYFDLDGSFPNHEANPLDPVNLLDLQQAVPEHGADLGLAFDGDADRCFVIDETGRPVSPSAITALIAAREIKKEQATTGRRGTVIHNLITSRAVQEVIEENGGIAIRTRVGHAFIKAQMAKADAVFGGEHSAHYYFRDFWFADTGMLAALHVLAALGEQDGPLSQLVAQYERYTASGEINSKVADVKESTERVAAAFADRPGVVLDFLDGLTVTHEAGSAHGPHSPAGMWWFNLRGSNTEPLLRLNAEAADPEVMARIRDEVLGLVRVAVPVVDAPR